MRPQKIDDKQLLENLMHVLRAKGYDGASLNELAGSSGLQKASLYHRFPGGKKDIGLAVLQFVGEVVNEKIVDVVKDKNLSPEKKLSTVIHNTKAIYDHGKYSCILRALSMGDGMTLFSDELENSTKAWIDTFTLLGKDFGLDTETAEKTALQVLIKVQGSLVVSKTLKDTSPFIDTLQEIEKMYKKE